MSSDEHNNLVNIAKRIRTNVIKTAASIRGVRGAHIGPSLSCVEILTALYFNAMQYDIKNPRDETRDRFILSKTHAGLTQYATFVEAGLISDDDLAGYHEDGCELFGYPRNIDIGMEFEGGSLGMGLSYGVGQALAAKIKKLNYRVYVLLGDGELNEGSIWEAFMSAAHYKLANLVAVVDRNSFCIDGDTEKIMAIEPLDDKLRSFGWHVISCNGHDFDELCVALSEHSADKPTAIIAKTVKGKGVSFMENRREWHQAKISGEQFKQAMSEMEGLAL